jgi:hypothetical protein
MTSRLRISFGFVGLAAMTVAMSGVGCGGKESGDQNPAAATGGTAASAGQTGTSGGVAASGAAGGAQGGTNGGAGGDTTTGGSGPTGQVGTLGQTCGAPGTLACAGNYQKLTLICGADGKWAAGQTCTGNQICDTRAGVNAGTCQDQDPQCQGHEPGYKFCVGVAVHACDADNLSTTLVESCTTVCTGGACDNSVPACPTGASVVSCAEDCGVSSGCTVDANGCYLAYLEAPTTNPVWFRTPAASATCACGSGRHYMRVIDLHGTRYWLVNGAGHWNVGVYVLSTCHYTPYDVCNDTQARQCVAVPSSSDCGGAQASYYIYTDDPSAGPTNVSFEAQQQLGTCP